MQTRAFVLSSSNIGEADRAYRLLTKDLGLVEAFSRSIRKPTSKLSGQLEPPRFVWLELIESSRGWQITTALEENNYPNILNSPDTLRMILQAGFILKELVPISHPDESLWNLWKELITRAEFASRSSPDCIRGLFAQFLIKLIAQLGFFPEPVSCGSCGRALEQSAIVIFEGGSALCKNCGLNTKSGVTLDLKRRVLISKILAGEWLEEKQSTDYGLWKIAKHFTEVARRLMI